MFLLDLLPRRLNFSAGASVICDRSEVIFIHLVKGFQQPLNSHNLLALQLSENPQNLTWNSWTFLMQCISTFWPLGCLDSGWSCLETEFYIKNMFLCLLSMDLTDKDVGHTEPLLTIWNIVKIYTHTVEGGQLWNKNGKTSDQAHLWN